MKSLLKSLLLAFTRTFRSRADLLFETTALRQQLEVIQRGKSRPRLRAADRLFWIWLSRTWPRWRSALVIVKPETVLRWHREGYRYYWRYRCKGKPGRPRIPRTHIELIRRISMDHPEWGEDRIALELSLKLGVDHSPRTVRRYMVDPPSHPSSSWKKFVSSHPDQIFAIDLTMQYLWDYSARYILIIMALHNRRVVRMAVTASPTLDWVKQQVREATAWDEAPRFLIHDDDGIFGQYRSPKRRPYRCALDDWLDNALGTDGIPIPYGAPNASPHIERFMGTLKRECLQHFIFPSEAHLYRTAKKFIDYYNKQRPHQGIAGIPSLGPGVRFARDPPAVETSRLVAEPILGGLHHHYRLAA